MFFRKQKKNTNFEEEKNEIVYGIHEQQQFLEVVLNQIINFQIDKLPSETAYQNLDDLYSQPARPTMEELHGGKVAKPAAVAVSQTSYLDFTQFIDSFGLT